MNIKLLLILLIAGFGSCTTAYKTGQTPDDVYYSPVHPERYDSISTRHESDNTVYNGTPSNTYDDRRYHSRRWRRDHYYDYDQDNTVYIDPKTGKRPTYSAPRKVNTGAYKKNSPTTINPKTGKPDSKGSINTRVFKDNSSSKSSSGTAVGNFLREVFSAGNNSSSGSNSSNTQSSGNSSGSGNSGSKSPGSNTAPVRKFGNN